jgi:hypothetical protein
MISIMASFFCKTGDPQAALERVSVRLMHGGGTGSVGLPLPIWGEGRGEGVTSLSMAVERPKPLTPPLSLWEREQTELVAAMITPDRNMI